MLRRLLPIAVVSAIALPCAAEEIRYFEQNGVTYMETRPTTSPYAPDTRYQVGPRTVLREQVTTEAREVVRTYWTPVTEYRWESYWVNRWNPFAEPYQEYRYVPRTRWERRTDVVQVPVACRRLVADAQTAPAAGYGMLPQSNVSRVAVAGAPGTTAAVGAPSNGLLPSPVPDATTAQPAPAMAPVQGPNTAQRNGIGGIDQIENEPPRYGVRPIW